MCMHVSMTYIISIMIKSVLALPDHLEFLQAQALDSVYAIHLHVTCTRTLMCYCILREG
jgi:hypothetical protein